MLKTMWPKLTNYRIEVLSKTRWFEFEDGSIKPFYLCPFVSQYYLGFNRITWLEAMQYLEMIENENN